MKIAIFSYLTAFFVLSSPAASQDMVEVGRIESIEFAQGRVFMSDGYIQRGQKQIPLRSGGVEFLYPGDKIYVQVPSLKVEYAIIGADKLGVVTSENSPQIVPQIKEIRPTICNLLSCDLINNFMKRAEWSVIPRVTRAHNNTNTTVSKSPLLENSNQLVTKSTNNVAVIWSEGMGNVTYGHTTISSDQKYSLILCPFPKSFKLKLSGEDRRQIMFYVKMTDASPPLPEGMLANATVASDGDRLERALFLLQPQYSEWHMFAISEIADLRYRSFAADLVWRQILTQQMLPND